MHVIVGKLFIETNYWNWLATLTNIASLLFYYLCVIAGNAAPVAEVFQPEVNGQYFAMLSSGKAWIVLLVLPLLALLPDTTYILAKKIFYPTPTDAVMVLQNKEPDLKFQGFSDVFCPGLPADAGQAGDKELRNRGSIRLSKKLVDGEQADRALQEPNESN